MKSIATGYGKLSSSRFEKFSYGLLKLELMKYSITGKKHLNGILHYKLKSDNSEEIFLSEYAVNDRFVTEQKYCAESNNSVSRLFTKLINKGYKIGKSNEK